MSPAVKNPYAPMFLLCCAAAALAGMIAIAPGLPAAQDRDEETQDKLSTIQRSLVLDGSRIHFAGELQMNVTNFGFFGSLPKSSYVMSDAPSAQWPAGSGVEYLYAAGLWVGAEVDGVPSVSTGYPQTEFYPSNDPIDVIYRSFEGAAGGRRYPADPDDDRDDQRQSLLLRRRGSVVWIRGGHRSSLSSDCGLHDESSKRHANGGRLEFGAPGLRRTRRSGPGLRRAATARRATRRSTPGAPSRRVTSRRAG